MNKRSFFLFFISFCLLLSCKTGERQAAALLSPEQLIDSAGGSCPYLTKDDRNNIILSWVRQRDTASHILCYAVSTNGGKTFGAPVEVPGSTGAKPHSENLPKVVFKPSGDVIAVWGTGNPNPKNAWSGLVFYSQSFDKGKTWTQPAGLVRDTAGYDQRYFDVALLPDGEAGIIWLDNRKTVQEEGSALYFAATRGKEGFTNEKRISQPCCQCCRTDLFVDRKGSIHVLYRGILRDSIRDMVHQVSADRGRSFSAPLRISPDNWVIRGCPHTGPAMSENSQGLHFAWFTGGAHKGSYYSRSTDGGRSYTVRDSISHLGMHPQLATLPGGEVAIVWDETVLKEGKAGKKIGFEQRGPAGATVVRQFVTPDTGQAGYPVVVAAGEKRALLAYSREQEGKPRVVYRLVELN